MSPSDPLLDQRNNSPWQPAAGAVTRSALGSQVAALLRESILRGHFSPGDALPEGQLAESFAVSRGPVRDALVELEREGLVSLRPHRTATVARLTPEDVEELYSLRLALELLAARSAARRATDEDVAALDRAVAALRDVTAGAFTGQDVAWADLAFHDAIYEAAHHSRLREAWLKLRSQIYLFMLMRNLTNPDMRNLTNRQYTDRLVSDHRAILETLRARDEEGSVRLVEQHLREPYLGLLDASSRGDEAQR